MSADGILRTLASFAVLLLVFVPLERCFPARSGQALTRPGWRVDVLFFFGQYLLWSGAAVALLSIVRPSLQTQLPAAWWVWLENWPFWSICVAAVLAGDVLVYAFHRACHRFAVLWRFHAVHHSSTHLDWLAAHREHPLDGLCTQLCQNLPAFLLGIDFRWLAAFVVFRGAWAIFIHSNVALPLGALRLLLGAPELHHFHHARVRETRHNFANLAPWIDVLFGTYHRPATRDYELGLEQHWPQGYVAQLLQPFRSAKRALSLEEGQQVVIDQLGVRGGHAVGQPLVRLQDTLLQKFGGQGR